MPGRDELCRTCLGAARNWNCQVGCRPRRGRNEEKGNAIDSADDRNGGAGWPAGRNGGLPHPDPGWGPPIRDKGPFRLAISCPTPASSCPWAKSPASPATGETSSTPSPSTWPPATSSPATGPPRRVGVEAVEGDHAAQVTLDSAGDAFVGHLTSPVVPVRGGPGLHPLGLCAERGSGGLGETVLVDPTAGLETAG